MKSKKEIERQIKTLKEAKSKITSPCISFNESYAIEKKNSKSLNPWQGKRRNDFEFLYCGYLALQKNYIKKGFDKFENITDDKIRSLNAELTFIKLQEEKENK